MNNPNSMNNGSFAVDPLWGNNRGNQSPAQDGANLDDGFLGEPNQEPVAASEPQVEQPQVVDGVGEKEQSRDAMFDSVQKRLLSDPTVEKAIDSYPDDIKYLALQEYTEKVASFVYRLRENTNVKRISDEAIERAKNTMLNAIEKQYGKYAEEIKQGLLSGNSLRYAENNGYVDRAERRNNRLGAALRRGRTGGRVQRAIAAFMAGLTIVSTLAGAFAPAQANAVTAYDSAPIEQADANGPAAKQAGEAEASESDEAEAQAEQESAGGGVIEATLNESVGQGGDTDGSNGETTGVGLLGPLKNLDSAMNKVSEKVAEAGEKLEARRLEADSILDTAKEVKSSLKAGGLNVSDSTLFKVVADTLRDKGVHTTLDTVKNVLNEAKKQGVDLDVETDKDATKAEEAETNKDTKAEEAEAATGYSFEATVDGVMQSLSFDRHTGGYDRAKDSFFSDNKQNVGSFGEETHDFMSTIKQLTNSPIGYSTWHTIVDADMDSDLVTINNKANIMEQAAEGYDGMADQLPEFLARRLDGGKINRKTISAGTEYTTFYAYNHDGDESYVYFQPEINHDYDVNALELLDKDGNSVLGEVKNLAMKMLGISSDQWGEWEIYMSMSCGGQPILVHTATQAPDVVATPDTSTPDTSTPDTPTPDTPTPDTPTPDTPTPDTPTPDTPTPDTPTPDTPDIPEVDHSKSGDPNAGDHQQDMGATDREGTTTGDGYVAVDLTEENHVTADADAEPGDAAPGVVSTDFAPEGADIVESGEQYAESDSVNTGYEEDISRWQEGDNVGIENGQDLDSSNYNYDYSYDENSTGEDINTLISNATSESEVGVASEAEGME